MRPSQVQPVRVINNSRTITLLRDQASGEVQKDDEVLIFTDDNFDDAIDDHEVTVVKFFAPWYGKPREREG